MTGYQTSTSRRTRTSSPCRRPARPATAHGHRRPRELRPDAAGRPQQLPAARRRGATTCAATARTSSAAAGASTPTSATPTRTCCSRRPTRAAGLRSDVFNVQRRPTGIKNPDGTLLPGRASRSRTSRARTRSSNRHVPAVRSVGRSAPAAAVSDAEQRRLVARADQRHGVLRWTT